MPTAPKPCRSPGCGVLVRDGACCPAHKPTVKKEADSRRGSSSQRGYGYKWQQARVGYLRSHPFCVEHQARDMLVQATIVDHKIPHRLDEALSSGDADRIARAQLLFWDADNNWQSLCKVCHDGGKQREEKSGIKPGCNASGIPLDAKHHWNKGGGH